MNKLLKNIGIFVVVIIMLGIPVLLALSFAFSWPAIVNLILLVFTAGDICISFLELFILIQYEEDYGG